MMKSDRNVLIRAYLADSDSGSPPGFEEGLQLYLRFGANQALKTIFQRSGATAYNHEKLVEELGKLVGGDQNAGGPVDIPKEQQDTVNLRTDSTTYAVPPGGPAANHPELVKRYRQRAMWKSQLTLLPTQEERRKQAFAILDLTDEIEGILYKGFQENESQGGGPGRHPVHRGRGPHSLPEDRAALAKRLTTNGKYISKYRDREDKQEEINRRRAENERIEKIISPS